MQEATPDQLAERMAAAIDSALRKAGAEQDE